MTTLQNKAALVTGASRGIGRATAAALARAGAHVLVHYGRSKQEAESLVAEIKTKGGRADAVSADLGTPDGASLLVRQVRSIVGDRLDLLVLNAGVSKAARIADYTVEDFDHLFATNVRGPFFLVQQLLPLLGEGSSVVVISSLGARSVVGKSGLDNPSILAYASTKGAGYARSIGGQTLRNRCANAPGTAGNECYFLRQLRHVSPLPFSGQFRKQFRLRSCSTCRAFLNHSVLYDDGAIMRMQRY